MQGRISDLFKPFNIENDISSADKQSSRSKNGSEYKSVSALVEELRLNTIDKIEKHHVQSALQILFWPSEENVWDKAETICTEEVKKIFGRLLSNDSQNQSTDLKLKDCLQVMVYLGAMREK